MRRSKAIRALLWAALGVNAFMFASGILLEIFNGTMLQYWLLGLILYGSDVAVIVYAAVQLRRQALYEVAA